MLCFGLQNINRTFVPTCKRLNMLDGALFVVCFLVNTLFLLFCGILTCNCISRTYPVAVCTLNAPSTVCCLFWTNWKCSINLWCYASAFKTSTRPLFQLKNGSLFVVSLSVNRFFVLFCCILTCKYINHTYAVAVHTLNTRSARYSLFWTAENIPLTFGVLLWPWKHPP